MTGSDVLFSAFNVGDLSVSNRIVLAPLTRGRAGPERIANEMMAQYYQQRAGAGLMITEATVVSAQGNGWVDSPGIYTAAMIEGWQKVTSRVQAQGTPFFLQMWHCGRASHSDFHKGELPVSASDIKISNGDEIRTPLGKKSYQSPRPLTVGEIAATVADYKQAAINAMEAGFSGVEVHAANGYLINQFLDTTSNHRNDEYGGSIENRYRFLKEVLDAVLSVVPSNRVGVRISPNGVFNDMGCEDFRELYRYVATQLNKFDLAYLHVMDGLDFGFHEKGEPMTLADFRPLFKGPIIGNCGYTRELAIERIEAGQADLIAFGRPFISNPDLPARFKNNWPLSSFEDMSHWYTSGEEGYTSYPNYQPDSSSA